MIATLRGTISEKLADSLVLEVGGVGYELLVTADDWGAARPGAEERYYVAEQIREDAHNLYGFRELAARQLFGQLIGISGVGPKVALAILSAAGEARLRQAIVSGDPALLRGISGVGPKTAQRVVLELRGKVAEGAFGSAPVSDSAYQALVALGYTPAQATEAVAALPADVTDDQARIKLALSLTHR
jgi:Holliday junction DNA helicase RuvA